MKILLDENLPESLVDELSALGHEVSSVNRLQLKGVANGELYHSVGEDYELVFTKDKGFAHNIRQMDVDQETKLILVVLPRKPAKEFVHDFKEYFKETDWTAYENGNPWPAPYLDR